MGHTCSKCSRINPPDATYCYYDGFVLNGAPTVVAAPVNAGTQPFPNPFVFPSGQVCRNFDQLALTCQNNWAAALEVIKEGYLEGFLGNLGRLDLARSAREAARFPDRDRGLDQFLSALPTDVLKPPRLAVEPLEINLGQLRIGEDRRLQLRLKNQGARLLYGSAVCDASCLWLSLGDGPGAQQKLFQFSNEMLIPLNVRGHKLRASGKPLEGRITIDSNGGAVTLVVRAEVPVKPFPEGALAGAKSPRQAAEKAKANPKGAAVLFENGAVERWYKDNGWTYPVQGPSATGLGAVQQFFEALGLTKPPKLIISDQTVSFVGPAGGELVHNLVVRSPEKRPVYAYAHSSQNWLKAGRPQFSGNVVTIPLKIPSVPHQQGQTLQARVTVTANGNQQFVVPVSLAIRGVAAAATMPAGSGWISDALPVQSQSVVPLTPVGNRFSPPPPASPAVIHPPRAPTPAPSPVAMQAVRAPAPVPWAPTAHPTAPAVGGGGSGPTIQPWMHALPVLLLAVTLLGILLHDFLVKEGGGITGVDDGLIDAEPRIQVIFQDNPGDQVLNSATMRFGVVMTREVDPRDTSRRKRLTYDELGRSNNTCLRVDGNDILFGQGLMQGRTFELGTWTAMKVDLGKTPDGRTRQGYRSVWAVPRWPKVQVTQTVEVVPGEQSRLLDTCLVRYLIENNDEQPHTIGLRFMLDCYIGTNDGVPYTIPGQPGLNDTMLDMRNPSDIPDFIQALENEDLRNPGTVAHIKLKLGGTFDPPDRVSLTAWPDNRLARQPRPPGSAEPMSHLTGWEVPLLPMKSVTRALPRPGPPDSAVIIYWNEKPMPPRSKREMGFTYGLGSISGGEGGGRLAVTASGSFAPGGTFTLTAYVNGPVPGETLTADLPEGFQILDGAAARAVPSGSGRVPVSWKVRCPSSRGKYSLRVRSSQGAAQSVPVAVRTTGIFD